MLKAERQAKIVDILRMSKYEKIDNLAFTFDVSVRTIKQDILELSLIYPIDTKQGRYNGGVYWDKYGIKNDNKETEEITVLHRLRDNCTEEEQKIIDRIIRKIRA